MDLVQANKIIAFCLDLYKKMMRGRPPTGSRSGPGIVGPQIVDRPMTQHGLGGMRQGSFTRSKIFQEL